MASLGGSVIGVSRSGRVRKKSAKLMEMEDSQYGEEESASSRRKSAANAQSSQGSTPSSGTIHISYIPQVPRDKRASYLNPKSRPTPAAAGNAATSKSKHANSAPISKSRKIVSSTPVPSKRRKKQLSPPLPPPQLDEKDDEDEDDDDSDDSSNDGAVGNQTEDRVIAIKQLSPTFDTLSGSAYLMGEDLHFITGEPVVSNDENSNRSNNNEFRSSDQLKVDVGYTDEASVSVSEESGLKMKFILSPKSGVKSTKLGKSEKSSSSKKKKSSKAKRSSHGASSKSKAKSKKKSQSIDDDVAALDILASGGILHDNDDSDDLSDENDDYMGESKLVIAEPRPSESKSKKKKRKKSSEKDLLIDESFGSNKKGTKKVKQKAESPVAVKESAQVPEELAVAEMTSSLPQSLYFKEKNSAKKKFNKKPVAKPKEKTEKKARTISAYTLWSQEYRKIIVAENPTYDFSQISKRLGEIWQSYSAQEKMQWRSKAKLKSGKLAIINSSNLINTSKKPTVEAVERPRAPPAPLKPIMTTVKTIDEQPLSPRDPNKVVGTSPLDVAAHLKLLGESLGTIGQRLTEHEGQIAVSGSLSVLLDSTLCALGPLLCLTQEVDQLNGCPKEVHQKVLDNIAYIMPGL